MANASVRQQIKQQEKAIAASRKRIVELKKQQRDHQGKRLLKAAQKAGVFSVDISDDALAEAFDKLVRTADSPSKKSSI